MQSVPLQDFVDIVGGYVACGDVPGDLAIEHVTTHSARIRSGSAFFALAGSRVDGHRFVAEAAANGAGVAVVRADTVDVVRSRIPLVAVDDPLRALQRLAAWWRRHLRGRVIAVTGSNGKTTTKDCLVHILRSTFSVYGSPGSYNSQLGVPLALLECPADTEFVVIEVAVSDPGEMQYHADVLRPDHAVLTNVGTRWRYRFANAAEQMAELLTITGRMGEDGWVLLGDDDPALVEAASRRVARTYVRGHSAELPRFEEPIHGPRGVRVAVTIGKGSSVLLSVNTASDEILADLELAVCVASLVGVHFREALAVVQDYAPARPRLEIWRSPRGVTLVRDVVTPDPMAVSSGIRTAKRLARDGGRTVVVLADPGLDVEDDVAVGLAKALVEEQADEVFAVESALLARTAVLVNDLDAHAHTTLFASLAELRAHMLEYLKSGDVCLVQSDASRAIGDLASSLIEAMAPTRLYIDLSAIERNLAAFRRTVGPGVQVMAMVKALAYGTDAVNIALTLQESGVDFFGVSSADEGIALRWAGINVPVVVFLGNGAELEKMLRYDLTPLVYSPEMFQALLALPPRTTPVGVHVEVDSGMHRAGFDPDEAMAVLAELASSPTVTVQGLMTHLACADDPGEDAYTEIQLDRFETVAQFAEAQGLRVIAHAAATAAAIRLPRARYDMVRIGLGLHGLHPSHATESEISLVPAMGLVSRIVQVVDVPPTERVGYGGTYVAPAGGGRVGVVPAGYHDCVPRAFSNFGYVVIAGVRCPIIGKVSMDSMTVDVSECPQATVGSDVLIYGRSGEWTVPLEEVSAAIGTIPYEVMARVGPRVQRIFTGR